MAIWQGNASFTGSVAVTWPLLSYSPSMQFGGMSTPDFPGVRRDFGPMRDPVVEAIAQAAAQLGILGWPYPP